MNFQFPACFARDWIGSVNLIVVLCVSEKDEERGKLLVFNVVFGDLEYFFLFFSSCFCVTVMVIMLIFV